MHDSLHQKVAGFKYSHLSNKREVMLTDFEKFQPQQKEIPPPQNHIFLNYTKLFKLELSCKSNMFYPISQLVMNFCNHIMIL